jgi:hypothetical protein
MFFFFNIEYHMFYVLYPFVTYLLTLLPILGAPHLAPKSLKYSADFRTRMLCALLISANRAPRPVDAVLLDLIAVTLALSRMSTHCNALHSAVFPFPFLSPSRYIAGLYLAASFHVFPCVTSRFFQTAHHRKILANIKMFLMLIFLLLAWVLVRS